MQCLIVCLEVRGLSFPCRIPCFQKNAHWTFLFSNTDNLLDSYPGAQSHEEGDNRIENYLDVVGFSFCAVISNLHFSLLRVRPFTAVYASIFADDWQTISEKCLSHNQSFWYFLSHK